MDSKLRRRAFGLVGAVVLMGVSLMGATFTGAALASATTTAESTAVNWAEGLANANSSAYGYLCLSFVHDAWAAAGWELRNHVSVAWNANTYPDNIWGNTVGGTTGTGEPTTPGALIFFAAGPGGDGGSEPSHVELYVGNNTNVSSEDFLSSHVHYETYGQHPRELGWWLPDGSSGGGGGGIGDGSFVSYGGNIYRIAGGAPTYVSSWNVFGGPQPTVGISDAQWAALPQYPADGTLVCTPGFVFEMAGGAPEYVSSWSSIGGARPCVGIDPADISNADQGAPWNHIHAYPADGTLVCTPGFVFEMAGGAPEYVSSWSAIGGARPCVGIDPADISNADQGAPWNHIHAYPADGTLVCTPGFVFEMAGGAPEYVSSWSAIGGARPCVGIDPADISNADQGAPWKHIHAYPADGTFLDAGGAVYEVVGDAPMFVSNWADVGGSKPVATVDPAELSNLAGAAPWNHLALHPQDGTTLRTSNGEEYVVAGGAALLLTDCAIGGRCATPLLVDGWDVANAGSLASGLSATPVDRTVVEGLPSGNYWEFTLGGWFATSATSSAVQVDDSSLSAFPFDAPPAITSPSSTTFVTATASSLTVTSTGTPTASLAESGSLPTGVTFTDNGDGTGTLAGTPAPGSAGTYPITLTATNGVGTPATQSFTLTVVNLEITTTSLPSGTAKTPYTATLTASGGNPPYAWKLVKGSKLPKGLKLSKTGQITGSPKAAGTTTVTIQVADTKTKTKPKTQNVARATFTITVS